MAATEMEFPWRWIGSTISTNFDVIWEMSAKRTNGNLVEAELPEVEQ